MFDDPLVQSGLVPLAVAAIAAIALRLVAGADRGSLLAAGGVGVAFLVGHGLVLGLPALPPTAALQKIFYVGALGLALGVALDLSRETPSVTRLMTAAVPAPVLAWIGWPRLLALDIGDALVLVAAALAAAFALPRLYDPRAAGVEPAIKLLVASVAAAMIAVIGASAAYGQLFGVLAAATGGFLLLNWPVARHRFGAAGALGAGLIFFALIVGTALFTAAARPALALLLLVLFAEIAMPRRPRNGRFGSAFGPILFGLLAAIPALAAVGFAFLLGGSGSGY